MKKRMKLISVVCALVVITSIALVGCGNNAAPAKGTKQDAKQDAPKVELQIFAANSLSKAMNEAQELYTSQNPNITFADTQYKASGELNEMLKAGTYADVEITASKGTMDTAVKEGYVDEATRINLFTNELVIVAKKNSGYQDVTLQDIANGKYTVCVGDDSVPAGNYAAQALSTVGAYKAAGDEVGKTGKDISGKGGQYVGINPVLQTSVGNVCKQAENGDVDVAIVYSSDVYRFGGVEIVGIIPDDTHKAIVYPGAVCKDSKNVDIAKTFLEWCITDPDAQKIWNKWGFELAA